MRAILIRRDGFRKCIDVARQTPVISVADGLTSASVYSLEEDMARDIKMNITEFRYEREYKDEFENHILIYKEMP